MLRRVDRLYGLCRPVRAVEPLCQRALRSAVRGRRVADRRAPSVRATRDGPQRSSTGAGRDRERRRIDPAGAVEVGRERTRRREKRGAHRGVSVPADKGARGRTWTRDTADLDIRPWHGAGDRKDLPPGSTARRIRCWRAGRAARMFPRGRIARSAGTPPRTAARCGGRTAAPGSCAPASRSRRCRRARTGRWGTRARRVRPPRRSTSLSGRRPRTARPCETRSSHRGWARG